MSSDFLLHWDTSSYFPIILSSSGQSGSCILRNSVELKTIKPAGASPLVKGLSSGRAGYIQISDWDS